MRSITSFVLIGTTLRTSHARETRCIKRETKMIKQAIKTVEKTGTKISKEKLLEAVKRTAEKEFMFAKDAASGYSVVLVKLG